MELTKHIAKHFRDVFFGGNWTDVNLKDTLSDINREQAVKKIDSLNTIAGLVFHIDYFVEAVLNVLQGGSLDAHDKYSFDLPLVESEGDWEKLKNKLFFDAEVFAGLVEKLPEQKLWEDFTDPKYGNYYKNIHGIIEHTHYHLGQIVLLKKMLLKSD
jgi:hypothetical protein